MHSNPTRSLALYSLFPGNNGGLLAAIWYAAPMLGSLTISHRWIFVSFCINFFSCNQDVGLSTDMNFKIIISVVKDPATCLLKLVSTSTVIVKPGNIIGCSYGSVTSWIARFFGINLQNMLDQWLQQVLIDKST